MNSGDEEVRFEQAYVDWIFEELEREVAASRRRLDEIDEFGAPRQVVTRILERMRALEDPPDKILHGRLDMQSEETYYIGRLGLDSDGRAPLVDYNARLGELFYQASTAEPLGVGRRRTIKMRGRQVVGIEDEYLVADFKPPDFTIEVPAPPPGVVPRVEDPGRPVAQQARPEPNAPPSAGPGPADGGSLPEPDGFGMARGAEDLEFRARDTLLEDLAGARSGAMGEIVATIQADQDRLIRSFPGRALIIQGGPGTGKTVVALHRVAWVLYKARELRRTPTALVVGPNDRFVEYVQDVLPALGEGGVLQTSLQALAVSRLSEADRERIRPVRSDEGRVARLKGDERMVEVVRRAVWLNVRPEPVSIPWRRYRLELSSDEVVRLIEELYARDGRFGDLRQDLAEAISQRLRVDLASRTGGVTLDARDLEETTRRHLRESGALTRMVPPLSARQALRRLFTDEDHLRSCAIDLRAVERDALVATVVANGRYRWSEQDGPLLDEAAAVIHGGPEKFTHVVVDEAQDLSPMQWRMVRRRSAERSMTITGDLAQATSEWGAEDWDDVARRAGVASDALYAELKLGYRVPEPVMLFAGRLLPSASPLTDLPRSFRAGSEPHIHRTTLANLDPEVVQLAASLRRDAESVAVIVPPDLEQRMRLALTRADVEAAVVVDDLAKGLEFDRTVVVAPDQIARGGVRGLRRLYICLTRSTKELVVVHTRALPEPLRGRAGPTGVRTAIRRTRLAQFAEVMGPRQAQLKVYGAAYAKWTPEEEGDLSRRVDEGLTIDEIADLHRRSPGSIRSRMRRLGLR